MVSRRKRLVFGVSRKYIQRELFIDVQLKPALRCFKTVHTRRRLCSRACLCVAGLPWSAGLGVV